MKILKVSFKLTLNFILCIGTYKTIDNIDFGYGIKYLPIKNKDILQLV